MVLGALVSCVVSGASFCFCQACTSLLGACCGNDKPSTVAPSVTSGRKRSVFLLVVAAGIALGFQYGVAPWIVDSTPEISYNYVRTAWVQGCDAYETAELRKICAGNNGAYRATGAATLFFLMAAVAAALKPTFNREAWPAKIILFLFAVLGTCFIPNDPLFSAIYLNIGRIGGIIFIFVQQFVIINVAHDWNDAWVEKANAAEREEMGSGKNWLVAILVSCGTLFCLALGAIIYMFIAFTGCPTNDAFISLTLIFCIVITATQLSGEEGSLLASSCVSAWAAYLCYGAVTKNLNSECNPMLGEPTPSTIVLGMLVTILSLAYTGWSYTAEDKLLRTRPGDDDEGAEANHANASTPPNDGKKKVTGVVVEGSKSSANYGTDAADGADEGAGVTTMATSPTDEEGGDMDSSDNDNPSHLSNSWRLNIALAAVACWTAMILTHWGSIQSRGSIANPSASNVAMWIVIASQWLALILYLWTLIAPRLFPDRDFS